MKKKHRLLRDAIAIAALGLALPAGAADKEPDQVNAKASVLDKIMVIGNPANIEKMPGSAQVVTKEDIRQQNYDDINRVLRKVPGVYVREEDGFGLFPSISLRGVDTTRSSKVTIMEDGVMMAPAPYTAPAAYYSPTAGRMSGLEVLKGSSQIKYGPHTTGGVINYLSTSIPTKETAYLKSTFGSFNEQRTHAYVGNTFDAGDAGQFGVLLEGYRRQSDGFKKIDETDSFRNGDDTGFNKTDAIVKLSWEPNSEIYQRFEFKYGTSELDANETYLGLSQADFDADPTRRYAASRFDNIKSEQEQVSLRWSISPNDDVDVITTLYQTDFKRNWYKLNKVNGDKLSQVIENPGLSQDCMMGVAACDLKVKANSRKYKTQGIETAGYFRFGSDGVQHEIMAGLRLHQDQITRFQWEDTYTQAANGSITGMTPGVPGDAGNRFQKTKALALFIQDTIETGAWTITPGVRYEKLDQTSEDPKGTLQSAGGTRGRDGENSFNVSAYGVGTAYQFNQQWTAFGGLHTGYSTPSPRGTRGGLDPESSTAFEMGTRYTNTQQAFAAESTFFYTAFDDLIVTDNVGGTGTGDDENFGEVDTFGVELALQYDAGIANNWGISNPSYLSVTYTNAEQKNDSESTDAESIFSYGKAGNAVPYIPKFTLSVGTGIETKKWGTSISGNYVSATYTSASNVDDQVNGAGDRDARYGKTDSYFTADVSAFYRINETVKLFGGVQNLFDKEYVVSRQPHGARGGLPRFVYAGVEMAL
ncbi:Outer membrane receptor for Fe3+-dicitrate [hydrothermal vent metagenome]|uniref:Outer membrane receptor for Fe3+-dicitrate n=1 Tax=hydrothermal vent metagenome TaxID=652676 RepID=A0A3B0ZJ65_9ZZZZ